MPTAREQVPNNPLRGDELAKIIEADVHDVLQRDCMMTSRVAYGRVSYELRVILHMDNPAFNTSTTVVQSHQAADDKVEKEPQLAALEPAPPLKKPLSELEICKNCGELKDGAHFIPAADESKLLCLANDGVTEYEPELSTNAYVSATQRTRVIESPNVSRIEHGLPVSVLRQGRDTGGNPMPVEEPVMYPKETVEDVIVPPVDVDLTRMVKQAFEEGIKP
jgi:hypothetical protein